MDAVTLRLVARVRLSRLLAQHDVGAAATLWEIRRAMMPLTAALVMEAADPPGPQRSPQPRTSLAAGSARQPDPGPRSPSTSSSGGRAELLW